ncbi:MAG: cell division protein [Beggiatoa sp. IS2]|nr:MAG: cell division protein [Beggiatoa sp. IS2]
MNYSPSARVSPKALLFQHRRQWLLGLFVLVVGTLLARAVYLQVMHTDFLQWQGNARYLRVLPVPAHRGMLLDRDGEPLAVSTPIDSVWVSPAQFMTVQSEWKNLATVLGLSVKELRALLAKRQQREFVYVKRHISPTIATQVKALNLTGVFLQREYHRYYPTGAVAAHVLGFTNIDDQGQEGLELAFDSTLAGVAGAKRVLQGKNGQIIANVEILQLPRPGQDIRLTIHRRLQYVLHRELQAAVWAHRAQAGSAIILDAHTGEVLALVNQPDCNPNKREELVNDRFRNRAVTDVFEPGSTLKPFTIVTALESGKFTSTTRINTHPGNFQIGKYTVRDSYNYGNIDMATIMQKSSNVGASKIALSLPAGQLWRILNNLGFGQSSESGFPGEVTGKLPHFSVWHPFEQATLSFGYGLNTTMLQLARAYAVLGNAGRLPPIRFVASDIQANPEEFPVVMQTDTTSQVLQMLEKVTQPGGTGEGARISGYRVVGKTGTVHKPQAGGYSANEYLALFVGIVPASKPRLVMAVLIDEPRGSDHYGGQVAAPVFAKVMTEALRLLNIPPDSW